MLQTFFNNGIRFFESNASGAGISTEFEGLPYSEQLLPDMRNKGVPCVGEFVDFNRIIRFVLWSDAAATVTIYNNAGVAIQSNIPASQNWALDNDTAYYFAIDLSAVTGINNGSYMIATNGTEHLTSEPLISTPNLYEIEFENEGDHAKLNTFQNCIFLNAFYPAFLREFNIEQFDRVFATSANRYRRLAHGEKKTRSLETVALPPYKIDAFVRQMKSDILKLKVKPTTSDPIRLFEGEPVTIENPTRYNLATAKAKIVFDNSLTMRLPYTNLGAGNVPTLLPLTSLSSTEMQVNWTGSADTYDLQVATDAAFSNIVVNQTGITQLSHLVTGLTSCTKYYVRVRGIDCSGTSPWVVATGRQYFTVHFRGAHTQQAVQFNEKIVFNSLLVNNVFGMLQGVSFKYSNGAVEPADWSLFPNLNVADLEAQIQAGGNDYWILCQCTGYSTQNYEGVLMVSYDAAAFYTLLACSSFTLYAADEATKDISTVIPANNYYEVDTIPGAIFASVRYYGLRTSNVADFTEYQYDNLTDLNNAIKSLSSTTDTILSFYFGTDNSPENLRLDISYL